MKIAEKEAQEKARLAEIAARVSTHSLTPLERIPPARTTANLAAPLSLLQRDDDPAARKAREKAAMLKADMDNAASLFGSQNIDGTRACCPAAPEAFPPSCSSLTAPPRRRPARDALQHQGGL